MLPTPACLTHTAARDSNVMVKYLIALMNCCVACFERLVKYLTDTAFVQIASEWPTRTEHGVRSYSAELLAAQSGALRSASRRSPD